MLQAMMAGIEWGLSACAAIGTIFIVIFAISVIIALIEKATNKLQ